MTKQLNPEETAAVRLQLITPLLDPGLDHQQTVDLKKSVTGNIFPTAPSADIWMHT